MDELSVQFAEALTLLLGAIVPAVLGLLAAAAACILVQKYRPAQAAVRLVPVIGRLVATGVRPQMVRLSTCLTSRAPPGVQPPDSVGFRGRDAGRMC